MGRGGAQRGAPWERVAARQEAGSRGRGQDGSRDRQSHLTEKVEAGALDPNSVARAGYLLPEAGCARMASPARRASDRTGPLSSGTGQLFSVACGLSLFSCLARARSALFAFRHSYSSQ